ncbi:MAG: hypothetical protein CMH63_00320 [Nanoarchaeota archaeon]|jgi:hypothetical protein|nr:hypothetical protein [Nanoarchaeota archaeon]|tara:strand:- start:11619 stop:12005 length:387 start_codon:yes stop_codon:yes gene_type:complete
MPEKSVSFKGVLKDVVDEATRLVRERLEREGSKFVGVTLNCSEEHKEQVVEALKRGINAIPFTGRNGCVAKYRDLSTRFFEERDFEDCRSYRGSYENAVFLFYDPKGVVGANGNTYTINFEACLNRRG